MELDGRKISREAQSEIRKRAVLRVEAGESPEEVIRTLGLHRSNIYRWLARYQEGGLEALGVRKAPGKESKLSERELKRLYDIITNKNPLQLSFEFALWTREMIREVIQDEFRVTLSVGTVGRLLKTIGLTPQKPVYKAWEQDEGRRKEWTEQLFPELQAAAKREGAVIYFGDEAAVRSDRHYGTTWAPKGQTPVVARTGARFGVNMVSAVSANGGFRFMTFEGTMNADRFIEFLQRMLHNMERKVFLVLDGHAVHKSAKVKRFVESTNGQLRIFILPPYSPDLNPDEWVWNWLKNHKLGKASFNGPDQLREKVHHYLKKLQSAPELIMGFFRDPNLAYIQM